MLEGASGLTRDVTRGHAGWTHRPLQVSVVSRRELALPRVPSASLHLPLTPIFEPRVYAYNMLKMLKQIHYQI
jgi:hypothetical protein